MTSLRQALADYLAMRRAMGYRLARAEKLLGQFLTYLEERRETRLRTRTALAWATLPPGNPSGWWASRLAVVRGFATYLHTVDPITEIPPTDLLRAHARRATPYPYSDEDIANLLAATSTLRTAHRTATYRTLIGLLVVTGMRVGEAIALDRRDFDAEQDLVTVRQGKFDKSRALPLHPTAATAVRQYLRRSDRPVTRHSAALFVSTAGTRLLCRNVQQTFGALVRRAGLVPHSAACRPRLHDLRHYSGTRIIPSRLLKVGGARVGCRIAPGIITDCSRRPEPPNPSMARRSGPARNRCWLSEVEKKRSTTDMVFSSSRRHEREDGGRRRTGLFRNIEHCDSSQHVETTSLPPSTRSRLGIIRVPELWRLFRYRNSRHRFAVCTLLDAYRQGHDPEARIARLATYLGHVDPKYTYWYLSAAPELMQLAADRLEHHPGGSA